MMAIHAPRIPALRRRESAPTRSWRTVKPVMMETTVPWEMPVRLERARRLKTPPGEAFVRMAIHVPLTTPATSESAMQVTRMPRAFPDAFLRLFWPGATAAHASPVYARPTPNAAKPPGTQPAANCATSAVVARNCLERVEKRAVEPAEVSAVENAPGAVEVNRQSAIAGAMMDARNSGIAARVSVMTVQPSPNVRGVEEMSATRSARS